MAVSLDDEHFEVRSHHPINAKRLRDSVKLVQIQAAASSCLDERFEDDIHSHLIAESEAVDHGADDVVNPHDAAFDVMLFDSEIEECRGNSCNPDGRVRKRRDARPARNGEPHFPRQLRSEVVKAQSRRKTDDARRNAAASQDETVTFRHVRRGQPISPCADLLQRAGPD